MIWESSREGWPLRGAKRGRFPPQLHQVNDRVDRKVSPFVFGGGGANTGSVREEFPHALGEPTRGPVPSWSEASEISPSAPPRILRG